jgi:formate hydrogenlyase subunit 3/multisubunit Na+/H+ antiporter MnhD subunit
MELDGMPLHPLVNDMAVALVPLSVLAGLAFALLPGWRWLTRWAAVLSTLGAMVALGLTWWTGRDLVETMVGGGQLPAQLQTHQDRANMLVVIFLVFTVVVVLAFFTLPAPSRLEDRRLEFAGRSAAWATRLVPVALVVLGLLALVAVVMTGHAGAQFVFGQ